MTQEEKELLIKDLCARLDTNLVCSIHRTDDEGVGYRDEILHGYCKGDIWYEFYFREDCSVGIDNVSKIKPYLFPLSSMTEEEAKELSILYGIKDILSINITDEYIDFKVDDGFCSFERKTIWYNEIISSTETFDWLNKNHFDYRGLIEKGLAIDATGLNIYC